jgi:hypothetical protein
MRDLPSLPAAVGPPQRLQGTEGGPLAWFAIQEVIDHHQVVRAIWTEERLTCDRLLGARARLLIDLGAEVRSDDPPRRYHARPQVPAGRGAADADSGL